MSFLSQFIPFSGPFLFHRFRLIFDLEDQVNDLVKFRGIASGLALRHPGYTAVMHRAWELSFPVSFVVPYAEKDFADSLSQWIAVKKTPGYLEDAVE